MKSVVFVSREIWRNHINCGLSGISDQEKETECDVLLVTYEYPYGLSETFLETEISYLAKEFRKIWVFPARSVWSPAWFRASGPERRGLPGNCQLLLPRPNMFWQRLGDIVQTFRFLTRMHIDYKNNTSLFIQIYIAIREAIKASLLAGALKRVFGGSVPYSYSYWKASGACALAWLRALNRVPGFITRAHGGDLYYDRSPYPARPFDNFIAEQADGVIAISAHGARYLIAKGFDQERVSVGRLGVRRQVTSRQSEDGIIRIVSCSNVIPLKRVDLIARALLLLKSPFQWVHFGDGSDFNKIKEIISRFPPNGSAILPGRLPNCEVIRHYIEHPVDVFVNVSTSEGVPVSIMEALVAGIPCIATDVGGSGEIVDETCGELITSEIDEHALVRLFESVSNDKLLWASRRSGALIRGAELCDAEKNYTKFSRLLAVKVSNASVL